MPEIVKLSRPVGRGPKSLNTGQRLNLLMHPLECDIRKLTSLIDDKFSRGIAFGDELPRLRALLKLQIVGAESLGDALAASYSHRAGEPPVTTPGDNAALLKTETDS